MAVKTQTQLLDEVQSNVRSNGIGGLTKAAEVRDLLDDIIDTMFSLIGDVLNSVDTSGFVTLSTNQDISGLKNFTTLPQSAVVPASNNDLVNKAYVDGRTGSYETFTASVDFSHVMRQGNLFEGMLILPTVSTTIQVGKSSGADDVQQSIDITNKGWYIEAPEYFKDPTTYYFQGITSLTTFIIWYKL